MNKPERAMGGQWHIPGQPIATQTIHAERSSAQPTEPTPPVPADAAAPAGERGSDAAGPTPAHRPEGFPDPIRPLGSLLDDTLDLRVDYLEPRVREATLMISASLAEALEDARDVWSMEHKKDVRARGLGTVQASAFREMVLRVGLKHLAQDPDAIAMLPRDGRRRPRGTA